MAFIRFSHDKDAIPLGDLIRLFARGANWKMPVAHEDWRDLLRHSSLVVTAWKDEQLVGFGRLLTDFVRWSNLYDVVVNPAFQRQGIGSQLVQRLLEHPRVSNVRTVWLGTAEGHGFYERFGFVRDGNGRGMLLVRRDRDDRLGVGAQLSATAADMPPVHRERPSFIVSTRRVVEEPGQYPGTEEFLSYDRPIGAAAGLQRLGLHVERLPPGHRTSLPHAHEDEEEFVYVLEGEVDAWIDGCLNRMVAGDLAAFPAGTGIAHTFLNNAIDDAVLLVGGERSKCESRIVYPLNPERRERMRPGRWWDDAPIQALGGHDAEPFENGASGRIMATDRLVLRWWRLDDADAMFRIFGDPAVHEHTGADPYQSPAAARAWLEREVVEAPARGYGHWAVVEQASGEVVGSCGFRAGSPPGEAEIGFTIARSRWGRGYATEIAAACVRFAMENLAASKVVSMTRPANAPARRVLEKLGLELRGNEEHDGVVWCVYETANQVINKPRKADKA